MVKALWQAWQDLNNVIDTPEFWIKFQQAGVALQTTGTYMVSIAQSHLAPTMGADRGSAPALDNEIDEDEAIGQVVKFLDSQGVAIPMSAPDQTRRERLLALLELALPLIAKFLLK